MTPDVLQNRSFYAFARAAADGHHDVQRVGADWLDDHDSPIRAHIFRHGAKEHQVADRGADVAQTVLPHRIEWGAAPPGWERIESGASHPGVILPDEGKNIRRLDNPDQPLAHADLGREHLELFRARSITHPTDTRFVIRYTLHLGSRRLRLIAPATHEMIQAIADQVPYTNPDKMPAHWDWYAKQVPREQPEGDKATHLARVKLGPASSTVNVGGAPINHHEIHDEQGKPVGEIRFIDRGPMLHVDWVGAREGSGSLGNEAMRTLHDSIAETYPHAQYLTGIRTGGFRPGIGHPGERIVVPIRRRKPTRLARPRVTHEEMVKELEEGMRVEQEHTKDPAVTRKIALDHLKEDPHYYRKLKACKLSRMPEDPEYTALVSGVLKSRREYAARPNPQPEDRPDNTPSKVLADWLEEHGIPGAHVVRMRGEREMTPAETTAHCRGMGSRIQVGPMVPLLEGAEPLPEALRGTSAGRKALHRERLRATGAAAGAHVLYGRGGSGLAIFTVHVAPGDQYVEHMAHIQTPEDLLRATQDFPASAKEHLFGKLIADGVLKRVLKGRGKSNIKLARAVLTQAPAGGGIVNNTFYKGGKFMAKAFKSIREVADRLRTKLARTPEASVGAAFDRHPTGAPDDRITLGDLKRVEDEHNLPEHERLSPRIDPQPEGAKGDDHPYTANVLDIARFVDSLVRKRIPSSHLKGVLADDEKTPDQKFMHLVTHLLAEHQVAPHISWYGEHMNTLDRLLHQRFASGPSDPLWGTINEKGELEGKHDPATHHPANVLFKALIAATSASQTPVDNLASAIKIWKDGAESGDPILHAPHYNTRELKKWTDQIDPGVLASTGPGPEEKARWYAQHIYGKYDFGEGKTPYSAFAAKVLMMDDPTDPRHGLLLSYDQNGRKMKGKNAPATIPAGGRSVTVDLPLTNAGGIRAKGWARYGAQTATGIAKLQAIVRSFSGPDKTMQQAYTDAARFLLSAHSPEEFDARMKKAKLDKRVDSDKVYGEGYLKKEDKEGIPGSMIFGPKFGAFLLNLHANDPHTRQPFGSYLTADKWWTRTWNRYLGNVILPGRREVKADPEKGIKGKKAKGASIDENLSANKRRLMRRVVEKVAKEAGVTPAELQADLWYYEQSLYRMLGAKSADSFSYADAAHKFLDPKSPYRLSRPC